MFILLFEYYQCSKQYEYKYRFVSFQSKFRIWWSNNYVVIRFPHIAYTSKHNNYSKPWFLICQLIYLHIHIDWLIPHVQPSLFFFRVSTYEDLQELPIRLLTQSLKIRIPIIVNCHILENIYFKCASHHIKYQFQLDYWFTNTDYVSEESEKPNCDSSKLFACDCLLLCSIWWIWVNLIASCGLRSRYKVNSNGHVLMMSPNLHWL